jgi:transposase InsO family protein
MKYLFIREHLEEFPVSRMCQALYVASSGYYNWCRQAQGQTLGPRGETDKVLTEQIEKVFVSSRRLYGSPRIHASLRADGVRCSRKRVARLMGAKGLTPRLKKHKTRTTDSQHNDPVAPNKLNREFEAEAPNRKWAGDITGIWTSEGWLYLAVILDLYSRLVVGWAMGAQRDGKLVEEALTMALLKRCPALGLLHHSDRGSQYTSASYRAKLGEAGIEFSMSRKGDCYDNAVVESFNGTLKSECVDRQIFATRAQARSTVFEYLEVFYNRQRLHSSLGYMAPEVFEKLTVSRLF